jgi:hypothetical protein
MLTFFLCWLETWEKVQRFLEVVLGNRWAVKDDFSGSGFFPKHTYLRSNTNTSKNCNKMRHNEQKYATTNRHVNYSFFIFLQCWRNFIYFFFASSATSTKWKDEIIMSSSTEKQVAQLFKLSKMFLFCRKERNKKKQLAWNAFNNF